MIEAYVRPAKLEEAIRILERDPKSTYPLGGGNILSQNDSGKVTVVDLQLLNLDKIATEGAMISIGACATLQSLIETDIVPQAIKDAANREGTINTRRTATLAGALVSSKGQSPIGAVMLAMGVKVVTEPHGIGLEICEWMSTLKSGIPNRLVIRFEIPMGGKTAYMDISKTPADVPMAHSAMNKAVNGMYTWVMGFNKGIELFFESGKSPDILLNNAYSHYSIKINSNIYNKQMISILHHRLLITLAGDGS
ncbi:MAG: FAD binding domain-containing protein [Anaerolineaceae bacterium]